MKTHESLKMMCQMIKLGTSKISFNYKQGYLAIILTIKDILINMKG